MYCLCYGFFVARRKHKYNRTCIPGSTISSWCSHCPYHENTQNT